MKAKENNYAFIDSQNLNLAIQDQGWKLDFGRFRTYLADSFNVTKAFHNALGLSFETGALKLPTGQCIS